MFYHPRKCEWCGGMKTCVALFDVYEETGEPRRQFICLDCINFTYEETKDLIENQ